MVFRAGNDDSSIRIWTECQFKWFQSSGERRFFNDWNDKFLVAESWFLNVIALVLFCVHFHILDIHDHLGKLWQFFVLWKASTEAKCDLRFDIQDCDSTFFIHFPHRVQLGPVQHVFVSAKFQILKNQMTREMIYDRMLDLVNSISSLRNQSSLCPFSNTLRKIKFL